MSESPARASAALALVLCIAGVGILAEHTGHYWLTAIAVLAGVCLCLAGFAGARETAPWIAVSSFLFVVTAALLTAGGGLATVLSAEPFNIARYPSHLRPFVYVGTVGCAAFGATLLPRQDLAAGAARSLITTAGIVCFILGGGFVVSLVALPLLIDPLLWTGTQLWRTVDPATTALAPGTFLALLGLTALVVAAVLNRLPVQAIVPRERRPEIRTTITQLRPRVLIGGAACLLAGVLTAGVFALVWDGIERTLPGPITTGVAFVTTAVPLRVLLILALVVGLLFVAVVECLRRLRRESVRWILTVGAHGSGGAVLLGSLLVVGPAEGIDLLLEVLVQYDAEAETAAFRDLVGEFGQLAVLTALFSTGCFALAGVIYAVGVLGMIRLVPSRTVGTFFTAAGLIGATIVAGRIDTPTLRLFFVPGVAIVVWDIGTYGQRLRRELSRGSRRLEVLHAGVVTVVAGLGVATVYVAVRSTTLLISQPRASAAVAAMIGLLLVMAAVRG